MSPTCVHPPESFASGWPVVTDRMQYLSNTKRVLILCGPGAESSGHSLPKGGIGSRSVAPGVSGSADSG